MCMLFSSSYQCFKLYNGNNCFCFPCTVRMDLDLEKTGYMSKKLADPYGVSQEWEVRLHFLELGKAVPARFVCSACPEEIPTLQGESSQGLEHIILIK